MTGAFVMSVVVTVAALAVLAVLGVLAFRNAGVAGRAGLFWRGALVVVGAALAWVLVSRLPTLEVPAQRSALEARSSELTARAIAPGSALACLDTVASVVVEDGCEKALFATPEAVAAAVAYVDARLSLLASSIAVADRDPSYRPSLERLRRALEADRFGLVAHVLVTRGCTEAECPDLQFMRDSTSILANMKARTFEARVGSHALAWQGGSATASAGAAAAVSPSTTGVGATGSPHAPSPAAEPAQGSGKYEFPSSESIPPVSIMAPEIAPEAAAPKPPAPAKRPAARRQSTRDANPGPPLAVTPPAADQR